MSKSLIGIIILSISFMLIDTQTKSNTGAEKIYHFYAIDGFEVPGEWEVKYSKFRSRKWNKKNEKPGEADREANREWYNWFAADDSGAGKFTRKEILPDFLVKHTKDIYGEKKLFPEQKSILGFKARWDYHKHNWISIEPRTLESGGKEGRYGPNKLGRYTDQVMSNDDLNDQEYANYDGGSYILLPGQTKEIALWVWGSRYDYTLEFHVEDFKGNLHVLNAGSINFKGWRRMAVEVPSYVKQVAEYTPRAKPLKLKRIRLVFNPHERLTGAFIYFDFLHGTTDTGLESYMGEGLEKSERIWKRNQGKGNNEQ